jgi:cytidine deaminase
VSWEPGELERLALAGKGTEHAPEIVVAFVAPSGTDRALVLESTEQILRRHDYDCCVVRLSEVLATRRPGKPVQKETTSSRAQALQDEGNALCQEVAQRADALAFVAVDRIGEERQRLHLEREEPESLKKVNPRAAYLVWSLKRPAEVNTLRAIYRSRFFLISIHTPLRTRLDRLSAEEADAQGHVPAKPNDHAAALHLIERDEHEVSAAGEFAQNVSDTYPLADFIVDASSRESLRETMGRAIDIIFGDPFATPTRAEYGMFLAHAAALKSAELGRQVGAAILTTAGDVVATGTNEVAKPSGGHFWRGDAHDDREFVGGVDTSDRMRRRVAAEIINAVASAIGSRDSVTREHLEEALGTTRVDDLIEFGRAVHAEMDALVDAARNGHSVRGCVLYVTTFPCHLCTRMIIAAGIDHLEYVYPYPKSLADELYGKQIDTGKGISEVPGRVPFRPFIGVAPRRYEAAFTMPPLRKNKDTGEVIRIEDSPRLLIEDQTGEWDLSTHIVREGHALDKAAWLKVAFDKLAKE